MKVDESNLYKTCDHLFQKGNSRLLEEKYNLKVLMRRDHKSFMWSPCQSVLTFILGLKKPRVR